MKCIARCRFRFIIGGVSGHTKGSFGSSEEESIRHYLPGVLAAVKGGLATDDYAARFGIVGQVG